MKGLLGWTIVVGSILLGFVVAIAFLAGLSGLIWDGAVFEPHPSRTAPWSIFFTAAIPVVAPVVAYLALCFIALPLLAKCNVPIDKSKGFYAGLGSSRETNCRLIREPNGQNPGANLRGIAAVK